MTLISELWICLLEFYFQGEARYHHLNKWSMWEFIIYDTFGEVYRSKGLRR